MTITFLQPDGVAVTAQAERQGRAAQHGGGANRPLGGRSGFRVDTATNILTATSTTWTLTPCSAMLDPGASTHQGMYGWATDANVTGSVTAADATYTRKDIVYIQVNDSSAGDGSGATTAPVLYLAGTPSASPVAPTLPARSFLVGTITVPQSGGGSPSVVLNPARYVAAGGILPVADATERDTLTGRAGLAVTRADVAGQPIEIHNGSSWDRVGPRVHANTQQVGSGMAANDFLTGTKRPWIQMGTYVGSTDAAGNIAITYPVAFANGMISAVVCNGDSNTGNLIMSLAGAFTQSVSTLFVNVKTAHTGAAVASSTVRIQWFAMGW